jgi:hypothetical protein
MGQFLDPWVYQWVKMLDPAGCGHGFGITAPMPANPWVF